VELKEIIEKRKGEKTWEALADELGVSRQTLWNALTGKVNPSYKLLKALKLVKV
jgi:DNA-binding XRE family transcriptional regulator